MLCERCQDRKRKKRFQIVPLQTTYRTQHNLPLGNLNSHIGASWVVSRTAAVQDWRWRDVFCRCGGATSHCRLSRSHVRSSAKHKSSSAHYWLILYSGLYGGWIVKKKKHMEMEAMWFLSTGTDRNTKNRPFMLKKLLSSWFTSSVLYATVLRSLTVTTEKQSTFSVFLLNVIV